MTETIIATWRADSTEDQAHFPQVAGEITSPAFQAVYWRCVACFFATLVKLRVPGRRILFTPAATITHLRGRSRATLPAASNAAYRRSHPAFYEQHHPRLAPALRAYLRLRGHLPRG